MRRKSAKRSATPKAAFNMATAADAQQNGGRADATVVCGSLTSWAPQTLWNRLSVSFQFKLGPSARQRYTYSATKDNFNGSNYYHS